MVLFVKVNISQVGAGFADWRCSTSLQNDGRHDRYTIGYESSTCRLGFFYEFGGGVGVQLGPIPADTTSWETMTWIGIDYIEAYLLNKPIAKGHRKASFSRTENIEIDISAAATSFVSIGTQAIAMFKDDETIALWKPKLEEYIKEDTRRRYGLE
ncbi:MAG: hypothetical protein QY332_18115 [Anaerolineales bacterium]|nr:MAG: hypothetical protein QY332_18115 [Anaerolineales bacterium]